MEVEAYSYRVQFWISTTESNTENFTEISPTFSDLAFTSNRGTREV